MDNILSDWAKDKLQTGLAEQLNRFEKQEKKDVASRATFLFLTHFDVTCDLLLNRRTATWILFAKWKHSPTAGVPTVFFVIQKNFH